MQRALAVGLVLGSVAAGCGSDAEEEYGSTEDMLVAGELLTPARVAGLLRQVGVAESAIPKLVCTAKHESSFYAGAKGFNKNDRGVVTSTDYGLFQINDGYWLEDCGVTRKELLDPLNNTECAKLVYERQGINAWYGYKAHKAECDRYVVPGDTARRPPTTNGICFSESLNKNVRSLTCVQSADNDQWYQCVDGDWYDGVDVEDGQGRGGACREMLRP